MIYLSRNDYSRVFLQSDRNGELKTLQQAFSFLSPGSKFQKAYQQGYWDGKVSLINLRTKSTLYGLMDPIKDFCTKAGIEFEDKTEIKEPVEDLSNFKEWLTSLKLPFEPRDYQLKSVLIALKNNRQVIVASTGSGKSLSIYILVRWHYRFNRKIVLVVPSTSLVEQMLNDFRDYSKNDPTFDVDKVCGGLYHGQETDPFRTDILVSTWQSICQYDDALMERWDVVLCDEVHRCRDRNVLRDTIAHAINAPYKIGFTGSLSGDLLDEYNLIGTFGKITKVTSTADLQRRGTLAPLKVYMVSLKHRKEWVKAYYGQFQKEIKPTFINEVDALNGNEKRNLFLRNLIISCKGTTMMLFNRKEHGKHIFDLVKEAVGEKRKVFHIDGDVSAKEREEIREAINNEKDCILIASSQTSATGINIPSVENLILNPSKSSILSKQSIGRILRMHPDKTCAKCYVIADDFSNYRRRKSYSIGLATKQWEIFTQEKFDIDFKTIENF